MKIFTFSKILFLVFCLAFIKQTGFTQATKSTQFVNPVPIPYLVTAKDQFLTFHDTIHNFAPNTTDPGIQGQIINSTVPTWAINQDGKPNSQRMSYLGPTLVWELDDIINMWTTNKLPPTAISPGHGDTTTAHWHGLNVKAGADGGPHQYFTRDSTLINSFPIRDSVQTLWYHSHVMEYTTEQVIMGLAGMVIVQDPLNDPCYAKLPHDYGKNDFPIVMQEKVFKFLDTGTPKLVDSMVVSDNPGNGEYTLVNGAAYGTLRVPPEMVRLRVLNGSPRKSFNIGMSPYLLADTFLTSGEMDTLWQIATDGSYTSKPHQQTKFLISPGERGEFLFNFSKYNVGDTIYMSNHIHSIRNGVIKGTGSQVAGTPDSTIAGTPGHAFMAFIVSDTVITNDPIFSKPSTLRPYTLQDTSNIARHRTKRLMFNPNAPRTEKWTIDSVPMQMMVLNDTVVANTMEKWTIKNETDIAHPFHIHKVQFQITKYVDVEEDGLIVTYQFPNLPSYLMGYKDVVLVNPQSEVTFIARFDSFPAYEIDFRNGYMYHCHILTHEDHSMMHQFTVVDSAFLAELIADGVEDNLEMASFSIYPNPAQNQLSLKAEAVLPSKLRIMDILGRSLMEKELSPFIGVRDIDISELPKGIILVEWSYGNSRNTWKIIRN